MKAITRISEIEAQKLYYNEQSAFERSLAGVQRLTFYQLLLLGAITWRTLYFLNATAVV